MSAARSGPPSVFLLPPYRMGPYRMRALPGERATFSGKRTRLQNDWTGGVVLIDDSLSPRDAFEWFVRHLVTAVHYRSGLNNSCNEEAFTHSLATGLLELAHGDPAFWVEFNRCAAHALKPRATWGRAAGGNIPRPKPPQRIVFGDKVCRIVRIPAATAERAGAYAFFDSSKTPHRIELSDALHGANLVLCLLHEVLHFAHECVGLGDGAPEVTFKRTQAKALLRLWSANPGFWSWWLYAAHETSPEATTKGR